VFSVGWWHDLNYSTSTAYYLLLQGVNKPLKNRNGACGAFPKSPDKLKTGVGGAQMRRRLRIDLHCPVSKRLPAFVESKDPEQCLTKILKDFAAAKTAIKSDAQRSSEIAITLY